MDALRVAGHIMIILALGVLDIRRDHGEAVAMEENVRVGRQGPCQPQKSDDVPE